MTYAAAMTPDTTVTTNEAKREIRAHGANWSEFLAEVPQLVPGVYCARDVLMWLGW